MTWHVTKTFKRFITFHRYGESIIKTMVIHLMIRRMYREREKIITSRHLNIVYSQAYITFTLDGRYIIFFYLSVVSINYATIGIRYCKTENGILYHFWSIIRYF